MLAHIRTFLATRAARLFFVVLIIPFVLFGVANIAQNWGGDTALATVGDRRVEPAQFQEAFRRQLAEVGRMMGGRTEPTPAIRRGIAAQTLQQLITQAAVENEVHRLGLAVPDAALRQAVFDIPAFRGPSGAFDKQQFASVLRQNNLTENRFLELLRADLGQRQLLEAVQAGAAAPDTLLQQVFAFQREQRVAELVELPFSAAPEPPAPTPEAVRAAYDNDPQRYAAPEFRRIKAVILSPETVAKGIEVPEAEIATWYEQHKAEFGGQEKRSLEVVVAQDEALAQRLAAQWTAGADWAAMQKAASDAGASSAKLDDTAEADIPGAELGEAAFKAAVETVAGPVKSAFGWQVLRVTKITPGNEQPLEAVHDQVRDRVARDQAVDQVYARANKLEDALSSGTGLEDLPGDLGLAAVAGSLDAKGNTPEAEPAPLPGTPALRQAIITATFATAKGEAPRLVEGPDSSYFALVVEDQTPPQVKPFDAVQDQVRENLLHDARRRSQEVVAARLLAAVKAGGSLDDAAVVADVRVERTPPLGRSSPTEGVPSQIIQPLFALAPNDATMLEDADGFLVVKLAAIESPDPAADPAGAGQIRTALNQAIGGDIQATYAAALRDRARPTVNQRMLEQLSQ